MQSIRCCLKHVFVKHIDRAMSCILHNKGVAGGGERGGGAIYGCPRWQGPRYSKTNISKAKMWFFTLKNIVNYFNKTGGTSVSNSDFSKVIIFVKGSHCDYLLSEMKKLAVTLLHCLWAALTQDAVGSMITTWWQCYKYNKMWALHTRGNPLWCTNLT